ncbi:MAG: type III secretion system chaperone [Acidobacteriota bacterium]
MQARGYTDKLKMAISRGGDVRLIGPVDERLTTPDSEDRNTSSEGENSASSQQIERTQFAELVSEFALQVDLPELKLDENDSCTITLGEDDKAVELVMQLRPGEVLIFTELATYGESVPEDLAACIEAANAEQEGEGHLLLNSDQVCFCFTRALQDLTSAKLTDAVGEFYSRALNWREHYDQRITAQLAGAAEEEAPVEIQTPSPRPALPSDLDSDASASRLISPSLGLKA